MKSYLSIDIGGTKILCISYTSNLNESKKMLLDTNQFFKNKSASDLDILFKYIADRYPNKVYEKLGISINCAIKNNSIIYSSLINGGKGVNLYNTAKKYLDFKQFSSDNDVLNMAKAELDYGYGKKCKSFIYINLGTGIRVVVVENGNILLGSNNLAGEVSPMPIWVEELQTFLTADNLLAGKGLNNLSILHKLKAQSAKEIFYSRDKTIFNIYIKYLSNFLMNLSYFYNPYMIIFGGSITKSAKLWLPSVKRLYLKKLPQFMLAKEFKITSVKYPASIGSLI